VQKRAKNFDDSHEPAGRTMCDVVVITPASSPKPSICCCILYDASLPSLFCKRLKNNFVFDTVGAVAYYSVDCLTAF